MPKRSLPTKEKATKILKDKEIRGKPITNQQRKFFGAVKSGSATKRKRSK